MSVRVWGWEERSERRELGLALSAVVWSALLRGESRLDQRQPKDGVDALDGHFEDRT